MYIKKYQDGGQIAAAKRWLLQHPEDEDDSAQVILERKKNAAIVAGKDPSYYAKMQKDGENFEKGALSLLGVGAASAAAAGAYGLAPSLAAKTGFAIEGTKNLAGKDGVRKTVEKAKEGDAWGTVKSAAGDALNAAMVVPGAKLLKEVATTGAKATIANEALNQAIRNTKLATIESLESQVRSATPNAQKLPNKTYLRLLETGPVKEQPIKGQPLPKWQLPKGERNFRPSDNEPFRKQLIDSYNEWIKPYNQPIADQNEWAQKYADYWNSVGSKVEAPFASEIPYESIPNNATIPEARKIIKNTMRRHNQFYRGVTKPVLEEDVALTKGLSDEEALIQATQPRPGDGVWITPASNAFIYGSNGKTALLRRPYKLGKNPTNWIKEGDFKIRGYRPEESTAYGTPRSNTIYDPWHSLEHPAQGHLNELWSTQPLNFVEWRTDPNVAETSLNWMTFKQGGVLKKKQQAFGESTRNSSAPFIQRLLSGNEEDIVNEDGERQTHLMASSDKYVFPTIQKIDGQLVKFDDWREALDKALETNNVIKAPSKKLAKWYGENYKQFFPEAKF